MILVACAVLYNFIRRENADDPFDNISQAVPHVGEASSLRRGASLIREGDIDVPSHIVAQFPQEERSYMVRVRDEIANQMWDAFRARPWYRQ